MVQQWPFRIPLPFREEDENLRAMLMTKLDRREKHE